MISLLDIVRTAAGIALGVLAFGCAELACDLLLRKGKR